MIGLETIFNYVFVTFAAEMPQDKIHTNSIGMELIKTEPGIFFMGFEETLLSDELVGDEPHRRNGDFDEHPKHQVTISKSFHMGDCQVTNAQYEQFAPEHRELRGKRGFSKEDDEAAVFVSWHEAIRFCQWLSEKEGLPYRLPAEAEWEYACRAETTTPFHIRNTLPQTFLKNADAKRQGGETVPLFVGEAPPNNWGLHDMHGNIEEWCYDWYGPYEANDQVDPAGPADGDFKVTRGGSHSTEIYYLRSANRMGTLPEDKHWLIGFRVVIGELPKIGSKSSPLSRTWQKNVKQNVLLKLNMGPAPNTPYFKGPRKYVKILEEASGPLFSRHNHDPAIAKCKNGDLLAIWYTCFREPGRELALAASRLRYEAEEWDDADLFWDAPDRNDHAPVLWFDGEETLYHFNGLSAGLGYKGGGLALIIRTSADSGVTLTKARFVNPECGIQSQPVACEFRTSQDDIVFVSDIPGSRSVLWISPDNGKTWKVSGSTIAGIHAGVVQLKDDRLMAFGRGNNIDGKIPRSISSDIGETWTYSASSFPPIGGGQRLVLMRLEEGPLFFASFTGSRKTPEYMSITDASGKDRLVTGLFAAISFDEGETWPHIRLVSDDGPGREVETMDRRPFIMGFRSAEPGGYLTACQSNDGLVHLISSQQHYAFNLAWLKTPPPTEPQ